MLTFENIEFGQLLASEDKNPWLYLVVLCNNKDLGLMIVSSKERFEEAYCCYSLKHFKEYTLTEYNIHYWNLVYRAE